MQTTEMKKTSFTGMEFMNLFCKKETDKPISSKPPLTAKQMKISANIAYPAMFQDNKPILTIRREHN